MDSANPQRSGASPASHLSSRSQHLLSNATSASPSINRIAPSLSSSSSGSAHTHGHSTSSSSILTMEVLLTQHVNAVNPTETALEALLVDRNNLSQQNAQLWKFVEKQKTMYASLLRDNDRLRGEREQYKTKWQKMKNSSLATASTLDTLTVAPSEKEPTVDEASSVISSSSSSIPVIPDAFSEKPRHSLEDPTTPRNTSGFGSDSHAPSEYFTPFQTPVRDQDGQASSRAHSVDSSINAINVSQSPPTLTTTKNHSDVLPSTLTKTSEPDANSSVIAAQSLRTVSPVPLVVPPRTDSVNALASSSRSQSNTTSSSMHDHSATQNHDSTTSIRTSNVAKSNIPESTNNHLAPYLHHNRPNVSMELSRESRITLPEEARQYIANMMDSPQLSGNSSTNSSPPLDQKIRPGAHRSNSAPEKEVIDTNMLSVHPQRQETEYEMEESAPRASVSTITSIGTTATDYSYPYGGHDVPGESESELEEASTEDSAIIENNQNQNETGLSKSNTSSKPRSRTRSGTTADQFPLPPSSLGLSGNTISSPGGYKPPSPRATAPLRSLNTSVSAPVTGNAVSPSSYSPSTATASGLGIGTATSLPASGPGSNNADSSTSSNSVINKEVDLMRQNDREKESETAADRSSWLPFREGSKLFRQMPLIDSDLKNTTTRVIGSHIKANEKGKEVLTFVIGVDIRGKPGWVIEKFYSDVLALDSRLRQLCNRSTIKKLAPLPDNKLFKDHAPTKVDQRKQMLQAYLQSLLQLPLKDKNEIIVFFSSDMMRDYGGPVTQTGYKEGYLTKRGKNFGGWKTRYFVLQGPVLEYYESRGGNHLGSIQVTGAQIGRQQKYGNDKRELEDDNEYRHAFLIIETKKNSTGQHPRHVLCAESDEERDAWVDVLVRYVMGSYNEEPTTPVLHSINPPPGSGGTPIQTLTSNTPNSQRVQPPIEGSRKHLSQATSSSSLDPTNTSSAQNGAELRKSSPSRGMDPSPIDRFPPSSAFGSSDAQRSKKDPPGSNTLEDGLSTSLPTSSPLDAANTSGNIGLRANSELGHYPDLVDQRSHSRSPENQRRGAARMSYHPTLQPIMATTSERPITPEHYSPIHQHPSSSYLEATAGKSKISGPINGAPILAGYQFGSRDTPAEVPPHPNDRERKAKSRIFWGFGRPNNEKVQSRPVFGVTLEESLAVSQIASLPSIVFRCIQYLEAKHAELEEGLYRLSGSSNVIKGLKDRFDAEGDVDLLGSDDYWDIHAIAGLLKQYLRDLAAPLLTHELNIKFHTVIDLYDAEERVREVQELISLLPIANYSLLRTMISHLIHVIANSNTNKMTVRNVGIVFCPTLGISPPVLTLMLGDFRKVFNVVDEGSDSPNDTTASSVVSNISRRNSKHYSSAAADQLLGLASRSLPITEEGQSDDAADDLSTNDESGTENATTEADVEELANDNHLDAPTLTNRAPSPVGIRVDSATTSVSENGERTPQRSRVANVAASRGLNLTVDGNTKADRRNSRMIGLPASPRVTRPPQSPSFPPMLGVTEDSSYFNTR